MATVTLTISPKLNKDNGKAEVLLRYRNTRQVALRAHTHTYILPKYFTNGKILIKNRVITPEVRDALEAQAQVEKIVNHIIEKGNNKPIDEFNQDWAQDTIDRLLFPENYAKPDSDELCLLDKTEDFLKHKKVSQERVHTYQQSSASSTASSCTPASRSFSTRPPRTPSWPSRTSSAPSTPSSSRTR